MEYQLTSMQEKLNAIAQKFDNDLSSLFAAITFLAYPQSTVAEFCHYLGQMQEEETARNGGFITGNYMLYNLWTMTNRMP